MIQLQSYIPTFYSLWRGTAPSRQRSQYCWPDGCIGVTPLGEEMPRVYLHTADHGSEVYYIACYVISLPRQDCMCKSRYFVPFLTSQTAEVHTGLAWKQWASQCLSIWSSNNLKLCPHRGSNFPRAWHTCIFSHNMLFENYNKPHNNN